MSEKTVRESSVKSVASSSYEEKSHSSYFVRTQGVPEMQNCTSVKKKKRDSK